MRSSRLTVFIVAALILFGARQTSAALFQYSIAVETAKGASAAFLWIPPKADMVRGVVVAGMTLAERDIVQDEQIRRACEDQQLAILFFKCGLSSVDLQKVLDQLAKDSGYGEIAGAPLFFIGHSAGGPQAKALAIKLSSRCFGLVQYRGGVPGGEESVPGGVPVLLMLGQFDEFGKVMRDADGRETWEGGRDSFAEWRKAGEDRLGSMIVEPGAGHFAWSERNAKYLALYIRKAAASRIAERVANANDVAVCKRIDPASGWVTDLSIKTAGQPPAPVGKAKENLKGTAWHFDQELADASIAYHTGISGKQDQFIRWNDPASVDAGVRYFLTDLKWVGPQSFEVHPAYADKYPSKAASAPGPSWADAGKPAGHSTVAVLVREVGGSPVVADGPSYFRIRHDALAPASDPGRVTFLAFSPGDERYRYTEQVGMMPRGFKGITNGREQAIRFPAIGDLKVDDAPVPLRGASDANLPVEYYVASGPAVIENGKLKITEIPRRATLPMTVRVVAWQFGSAQEPQVKTAVPVEQTIQLRAK